MAKSNKKKWMKFRHKVVRNVLFPTLGLYSRIKYNATVERFLEQEDRPYLILLNHQTPFDQFFVGMAFKGPIYYLATEDIFSKGFVSSLIKYLVAPIPIKKQTTDVKAILNCIRVAREGGTIAIAPEGNRTYSGRTEYMSPSIVPLARKLGNPIALYRLEGGYGTHPRWSDVVRRGRMRGYVSRVIYPEEYANMTDDELFAIIEEGLYVDEATSDKEYRHKKRAEYLERAIYVCPFCGLSEFESHGDKLECKKCGRVVKYLETTELVGDGYEHPYRFVADWYDAQKEFINSFDVLAHCDEPLYSEDVSVYKVIPCEKKELLSEASKVTLLGDRLILSLGSEDIVCSFEDISSVAVLGRNKLNVYHGDKIYQLKGSKRFNALKYVHIYHRHKNVVKGDANGEFLGL